MLLLFLNCMFLCTLATPLPSDPIPLCPIFGRGVLNFDDAEPGPLKHYQGFSFPGTVDWFVVNPSLQDSAIPYYKGVTSSPQGLLSSFHWMTRFTASSLFTFDLISLNITALTATASGQPSLKIKIWGFRPGDVEPSAVKTMRVRNAFMEGVRGVFVKLGGREWRGLDTVGIEAEEEKKGIPAPGDVSPGFVLDDVVYLKRTLC